LNRLSVRMLSDARYPENALFGPATILVQKGWKIV
jgi:hypothetical protein